MKYPDISYLLIFQPSKSMAKIMRNICPWIVLWLLIVHPQELEAGPIAFATCMGATGEACVAGAVQGIIGHQNTI